MNNVNVIYSSDLFILIKFSVSMDFDKQIKWIAYKIHNQYVNAASKMFDFTFVEVEYVK